MDKDLKILLYIKGYEEGQKEAWKDIKRLIKRHDGWDLRSRIESKVGTLYQDIASKKAELMDDPTLLEFDDEQQEEPKEEDVEWDESFYLVIEDKPSRSMSAFKELVEKGYDGICISNEFPMKLKNRYDLPDEKVLFVQLQKSNYGSNATVKCIRCSPANLSNLSAKIGDLLKNRSEPIILLHGVHTLTLHNDLNRVLSFIDWIKGKVHSDEGFFITSISSSDFSKSEIGRFKGHFDGVIYDR